MKEKPYFCIYIRKINMRKLYFTLCLSAVALLFSCGNEKQPEAPTPAEKSEQEERVDTLAMLVMPGTEVLATVHNGVSCAQDCDTRRPTRTEGQAVQQGLQHQPASRQTKGGNTH